MKSPTLQVHSELLSPAECRDFINRAETTGYQAMQGDYPPSYRNNDRVVIDDPELARTLFARFRYTLPDRLERGGQTWQLVGLNSRFRGCRYSGGQQFTRHRDGAHSEPDGAKSFLTLMLYLNDHSEFEGGHTRFYEDRWTQEIARSVPPAAGTGIVFDHTLWHDGQAVTRGKKYVLRTDVMYRPEQGAGRGHTGYVWALTSLPDGRLASGSRDKTVRIWEQGTEIQVLQFHQASVTCLACDGRTLWSGSRDRRVAIWASEKGVFHLKNSFIAHQGAVLSMTALSGGRLLTTGADNLAKIWKKDGILLAQGPTGPWPWASCQSSDGNIYIGCDDGSIQRFQQSPILWRRAPVGVVSLLTGASDELLAGCADGRIRRWQRYGHALADWVGHRGPVTSLELLPDGRVLSGSEDDGVRAWTEGRSIEAVRHGDFVRAVSVLEAGRLIATASYDGSVRLTPLCESKPRAIALTERAANPLGAQPGTAVAI